MQETTIDVRGAKIRALEGGAGTPILLLHGIDGPRADPLVTELAKSHRIIVPEIPGFARSPTPGWMMSVADAALFGLDLVEALKIDRLHLVGHSIGGWIAAEMALRHGTPFSSLTLISAMGVQPNAPAKEDIFIPPPEPVLRAQFHDQALADKEFSARAGEDIDITLQNRAGLARLAWTPRLSSVMLPHWLHRIHAPTLILWGEDDRIAPVDCADVYKREIARSEVVKFANCGHALPYEKGVEAAKRIQSFVAGAR